MKKNALEDKELSTKNQDITIQNILKIVPELIFFYRMKRLIDDYDIEDYGKSSLKLTLFCNSEFDYEFIINKSGEITKVKKF